MQDVRRSGSEERGDGPVLGPRFGVFRAPRKAELDVVARQLAHHVFEVGGEIVGPGLGPGGAVAGPRGVGGFAVGVDVCGTMRKLQARSSGSSAGRDASQETKRSSMAGPTGSSAWQPAIRLAPQRTGSKAPAANLAASARKADRLAGLRRRRRLLENLGNWQLDHALSLASATGWRRPLASRYYCSMRQALTGTLHGRTIELDESEESLEGLRVLVILEPLVHPETRLSAAENALLLKEWAARGPQGPLDDDSNFPNDLPRENSGTHIIK